MDFQGQELTILKVFQGLYYGPRRSIFQVFQGPFPRSIFQDSQGLFWSIIKVLNPPPRSIIKVYNQGLYKAYKVYILDSIKVYNQGLDWSIIKVFCRPPRSIIKDLQDLQL